MGLPVDHVSGEPVNFRDVKLILGETLSEKQSESVYLWG